VLAVSTTPTWQQAQHVSLDAESLQQQQQQQQQQQRNE
jgi:hypothetical protein